MPKGWDWLWIFAVAGILFAVVLWQAILHREAEKPTQFPASPKECKLVKTDIGHICLDRSL